MKNAGKPVLLAISAATVAAVATASFLPDARLWGINHLAFFPLPLRVVLLALVAICFVPSFARLLLEGFLSVTTWLTRPGRNATMILLALGIVAVGVFWLLRMGTPLLGDGHLLAKSYTAAQNGNDELIPSSMANILKAERIAVGTTMLNHWTGRWAHQLTGASWVNGWRFLYCLLGGAFVLLLFSIVRSSGWTPTARLWLLTLPLFSAVMELFFGYVENYTPLTFFLMLYAASAVRVLQVRGSLLWPVLLLLLCIFLHVQALIFLPSLVFLVLWRTRKQREPFVESRLPWVLMGITALTVAVAWLTPLDRFLLPWIGAEGEQAVLTWGHMADILNEIFLVFPAIALFVGFYWLGARHVPWTRACAPPAARPQPSTAGARTRSGRNKPSADAAPVPWLQTRAEWLFFALVGCGSLFYLLFFHAAIGVARDWDLFSMIGFAMVPLAIITWNRYSQFVGGFQLHAHAVLIAPLLALTLVMGMAWVLLNHSVPQTTRRFEAILGWETARVAYGLEALAATYYDEGLPSDAVRIMERAIIVSPNKRLRALLGTYHFDAGNYERARELLVPEVERTPEDINIRIWLIRTLHKLEDYGAQEQVLRDGVRYHPDNSRFHLLLGELLLNRGQVDEGVEHLRMGRQGDMPEAARTQVDALIRKYGGGTP